MRRATRWGSEPRGWGTHLPAQPLISRPSSSAVMAGVFCVLTGVVRMFHLDTAYDVFIDEISYLRISQTLATGGKVDLYGQPFYLHPPGYFLLEGYFLKIFAPQGDTISQIIAVRHLNVAVSMVTVVALFLAASACGGRLAGGIAAALFTIDPYMIKIDSLNMLEPFTLMWVMIGMAVLLRAIRAGDSSVRTHMWVGMAFGCALLSKETATFVTLLPCAVWAGFGWSIRRRLCGVIAATAVGVYMIFPLSLMARGVFGAWFGEKIHEIGRLAGAFQETGFNVAGHTSLWTAIQQNLSVTGSSYVIFAAGAAATLVLLVVDHPGDRCIAGLTLSVQGLLAYSIARGTIEEQMFYLLAVPSALAIAAAITSAIDALDFQPDIERWTSLGSIAGVASYSLLSTILWANLHTTSDTAMIDMVRWVNTHVPRGTTVATAPEVPIFLITGHSVGNWLTPAAITQHHSRYLVLSSKLIQGGYTNSGTDITAWAAAHGRMIGREGGRTYGDVTVYQLTT